MNLDSTVPVAGWLRRCLPGSERPSPRGAIAALVLWLSCTGSIAAAAEPLPSRVEQVIIAFKTHFDIGYTDMASNVVQRYRTTMIDQALQVCEQSRELSGADPLLRIIPKPAGLVPRPGRFVLNKATVIYHSAAPEAEETARYLAGVLRPATGFRLRLARLKDGPLPAGAIVLVQSAQRGNAATESSSSAFSSSSSDLPFHSRTTTRRKNPRSLRASPARAAQEAEPCQEGYRLSVTPQNVRISAASSAGLFHGVQTLRQLLPAAVFAATKQSGVEWSVPAVEITDQPRYSWRGSLLDVARHYLPVDFLKRYIDLLALHKMNVLQLHLTDDQGWRLEIKRYPRLTQVGSFRQESPKKGSRNEGDATHYGPYFYSQKQMRELVEYAQARHVTIVPEIEMPGHFLAALTAHPEFSCTGGPFAVRTRWGVEPNILCAGNEQAIAFAQAVLSEVMELFPSRFIHIGGDEAPKDRWKQCAKCQTRLQAEGLKDEHELQSYFVRRMDKFIAGRGRRLIGWDEILEGGLAPGATVMSWRGITGGIAAANAGHDVVMSPTSHCYFDYAQAQGPGEPEAIGGFLPLPTVYAYEPAPPELSADKKKHILGAQGNVWGEFIWTPADAEYFAFPRVAALAEVVWTSAEAKNYDDFLARLAAHLKRLDVLGVNYRRLTSDPDRPATPVAPQKSTADQPFVWTVPGWPMHKILEDWPGQTAERKQNVLRAFKEGRFAVHALPFSTHTELLELEDLVRGLGFASRLARDAGLPLPRDAKMTDVPCHSWIVPTLLRHAGVDFLHLGCNAASASPEVPPLFWWEGPDGSRLLTMYTAASYGTGLVPPKNWPHKTWLALIHTGDNHGPPTPNEVKQLLAEAKQKLPGVQVRIGRLSDFADALLAEKPALPVVRGDMPDTWIHGPMSDPAGARIARNTRPLIASAEALHTLLDAWGVMAPGAPRAFVKAGEQSLQRPRRRAEPDPAADLIAQAYEQSLLYGEHTWGGALYWVTKYGRGAKWGYGDTWQADHKAGRFQRLEDSWAEHTAYIKAARGLVTPLLSQDLKALAQAVQVRGQRIVVFNPLPWPRDGLVTVPFDKPGVAALKTADTHDVVLVDARGQQLSFMARHIPPMGYRTFLPVPAKGVSGRSAGFQPAVSRVSNLPAAATSEEASRLEIGSTADKRSALQRHSQASPPLAADARTATLESPFFKATLDTNRFVLRSLIDKRSGRELVDNSGPHGFGQCLYERFDSNNVASYVRSYVKIKADWAINELGKPNLPPAEEVSYRATSPANFRVSFDQEADRVLASAENVSFQGSNYVGAVFALSASQPYLELTLTLRKPADPWPEAGWICLPFKVDSPQFRLGRQGSIVNPALDIVPGANRHLIGLNTGLAIIDPQGRGVGLCALDNPLVSLDTPGCWKYSANFVPRKPVVYVNLFNNQWTTNFRLWNEGTWTARVRIWAFDKFEAEPSLITPSLEARFPLQAALAEGLGTGGKLPPTRAGLELSRKGVLVTAFGPNADGPGTVLRLWELAGESGECRVRLPAGLEAKGVQPVDLRGRPADKTIEVKDRSFDVRLSAFAPASFQIVPE